MFPPGTTFVLSFVDAKTLPPRSAENALVSVKVINQDGDSVYYSYGYDRWDWYLSVRTPDETNRPCVSSWAEFKGNTDAIT